jgi:hypothetical protein
MFLAAAVTALAAFLPWASFLGYSRSGVSDGGDGIVTLIAALIGLVLLWQRRLGWIGQLVPAAVTLLVALYDLSEAGNLAAIGLYLTFLAGIAWIVGVFMARQAAQAASSSAVAASTGDPPSSTLEP